MAEKYKTDVNSAVKRLSTNQNIGKVSSTYEEIDDIVVEEDIGEFDEEKAVDAFSGMNGRVCVIIDKFHGYTL